MALSTRIGCISDPGLEGPAKTTGLYSDPAAKLPGYPFQFVAYLRPDCPVHDLDCPRFAQKHVDTKKPGNPLSASVCIVKSVIAPWTKISIICGVRFHYLI